MQTATVFKECLPGNTTNHLYIIMIHEEDKSLQLYQSQSDDPEPAAFGILTSKPLPHFLVSNYTQHVCVIHCLHVRFQSSLCMMETRLCVLSWSTITN